MYITNPLLDLSLLAGVGAGRSIEPVLGRVIDLKRRRLALARLGRAPPGRVHAVNLLHSTFGIGFESARWWGQHLEFQPGHRRRALRGRGRALGRRGVGDLVGKVDAIVRGRGMEVERWRFGIGEVVLARDDQVAGEEVGAFAFGGWEGEGGRRQGCEDFGAIGGNTGGVVERRNRTDSGRCCRGIGGVGASIVLRRISIGAALEETCDEPGSRDQWQHGRPRGHPKAEVKERRWLSARSRRRDHIPVLSSATPSELLFPASLRRRNLERRGATVIHFFSVSMLKKPVPLGMTVTIIGAAYLRLRRREDVEVEGGRGVSSEGEK